MTTSKLTAVLALASLISGCSFIDHRCPLGGGGGPECRSMHQSYNDANQMQAMPLGAETPAFAPRAGAARGPELAFQGFPQPRQAGAPVYEPARVHRAWTAPWTDADGNLHAGEYVYFTTPGRWAYGGLKSPGEASGIFRPRRASDASLEVTTALDDAAAAANLRGRSQGGAALETPLNPRKGAQPATQPAQAKPAVQTAPSGITPPYQKLGTDSAPSGR